MHKLAEIGLFVPIFCENSGVDPDGSQKIGANCPISAGTNRKLPKTPADELFLYLCGISDQPLYVYSWKSCPKSA